MVSIGKHNPISNENVLQAEFLSEQLKLMASTAKGRVVWLKGDLTVGRLSLIQKICLLVLSWFGYETAVARYFIDFKQAIADMALARAKVIELKDYKPELAHLYRKCWDIFKERLAVQAGECKGSMTLDSDQDSLDDGHSDTDLRALSGQSRNTNDSPSDFLSSRDLGAQAWDLSTKPYLSPKDLFEVRVIPDESTSVNPFYDSIKDFVSQGLLGQARWIMQNQGIEIDDIAQDLPPKVVDWMKLQREFNDHEAWDLESMALTNNQSGQMGMGWGYKSANLVRLQALAQAVSNHCDVCEVRVPSFLPIGDFEMQSFIQRGFPELNECWEKFINTFTRAQINQFLSRKQTLTLNDQARSILDEIRQKIKRQFSAPYFITPQLQEWLHRTQPQFVIVRSTGKEDSDSNSNAGGNASIPFVTPTPQAISNAIGEVLASYFGEKSILQRFAVFDSSVFLEPPFLPVLIQEMIGENVGGDGTIDEEVPRSGVMFTFSEDKARGLTEMYVGLGNNEGIVSSQVTTDHYRIDEFGCVAKTVHNKTTRFVSVKKTSTKYACEPIKNSSSSLVHSPALPNEVAKDMKKVADYISNAYSTQMGPKALDVEFTIKMNSNGTAVIYLLQARPLKKVERTQNPSYLSGNYLANLQSNEKLTAKVLLDGGAYVREVAARGQVIVSETIQDACSLYFTSRHQSTIKTVIINKPAPGTSHEAVMLRLMGVGVLVVEDRIVFNRAIEMVNNASINRLWIDMQRGIIAPKNIGSDDIQQGYVCYPMALEYTMQPSELIIEQFKLLEEAEKGLLGNQAIIQRSQERSSRLFERLLNRVNRAIETCQDLTGPSFYPVFSSTSNLETDDHKFYTMRDLLDIMATGNREQARKAIATLLKMMRDYAFSRKQSILPRTRLELVMILENVLNIVVRQMLPALKDPACSLERLYPVRLIEACLYQEVGKVRGGFSWAATIKSIRSQAEAIGAYQQLMGSIDNPEDVLKNIPLLSIGKFLIRQEHSQTWDAILSHMSNVSVSAKSEVFEMVMLLSKLNSIVEWANADLVKLLSKHGLNLPMNVTHEKTVNLFNELAQKAVSAKEDLHFCLEVQQELATLRQNMNVWGDPDHVSKHAATLAKVYQTMGFDFDRASPEKPHALSARYKKCEPTVRLTLLRTFLDAIRTYDEIIKTCSSSTLYSSQKLKATNFKILLNHYWIMMQAVIKMLNDQGEILALGGYHPMPITVYLNRLSNGDQYNFGFGCGTRSTPGYLNINPIDKDESQCAALLLPSPEFNVSSAIVGGKADYHFSVIWPTTLEDYFTLFHQNMETSIGLLRSKVGFNKEILPEQIRNYCTRLETGIVNGGNVSFIDVVGSNIEVEINIPLRQHAGKIRVKFNRDKTPLTIQTRVEMYGNPEHARWELTAGAVCLIGSDLPNLKMSKPQIDFRKPKGVSFEFETVNLTVEHINAIIYFLNRMSAFSMKSTSKSEYLTEVKNLRFAFGSTTLATTEHDLANGGFYMVLGYIEELINTREFTRASSIYGTLGKVRVAHPWIDQLVNVYTGFLSASSCAEFSRFGPCYLHIGNRISSCMPTDRIGRTSCPVL